MTKMKTPAFTVTHVSLEGLGFGRGTISRQAAAPDVLALVNETIDTNPDLLVPIGSDDNGSIIEDDGCGDGRDVIAIFAQHEFFKRSLDRPKVFGGGTAMSAAARIGLGLAKGKHLNQVFNEAIDDLERAGLGFGAHTDDHAHGSSCGCGAIDKAELAVFAALKYESPIRESIRALAIPEEGLGAVMTNYRGYVSDLAFFIAEHPEERYSGQSVMDKIIAKGRVVKQLAGAHKEVKIILNQVRGYTVNQALIRNVTNEQAQVFAVDVWRMQDIASRLYAGRPGLQQQAFLSELLYTLAVAAVLTKGDLPVDIIQEKQHLQVR